MVTPIYLRSLSFVGVILGSFALATNVCAQQYNGPIVIPAGPGNTTLAVGLKALADDRYQDAINAITPAISQISSPGLLATAYANRGVAYCALDRTAQGVSDYEAAIAQVSNAAEIYAAAGACMFRAGQDSKARDYFQRGMKACPPHRLLMNDYAWFLATCPNSAFRDGKQALVLATKAHDRTRNDGSYLDTLAAAEAEAGAFDKAVEHEQLALAAKNVAPKLRANFEPRLKKYRNHQPFHERPTEKY